MDTEIIINNVLVNDSLTVNELNILKCLFGMTNERYIMHKTIDWHKFDASEYKAKEIICTYKHYFLKGIKDTNPRITWVKKENHIITRALRYLLTNPVQPLKFEYNREHESLFVFREKKVRTFNFQYKKRF